MVSTNDNIVTLDPRETGEQTARDIAPRSPSLDGKILGLLSNNKPNSEELLRNVADLIKQKYDIKEVVEANKGTNRTPAPAEMIDDLASRCDVVITATAE